jgi:DNA-binding PadR family transcriptional regulator
MQQPRSGYDVKKTFTTTPMGRFSDSPGSIYPALRRLEQAGLVQGAVDDSRPLRPRKVFRLTRKGQVALERWVSKPVERDDLVRRGEQLMLRFAFMETLVAPDVVIRFLTELRSTIQSYVEELEQHLASAGAGMSLHGRLALEGGIEGHRAHALWSDKALRRIRREVRRDRSKHRRSKPTMRRSS